MLDNIIYKRIYMRTKQVTFAPIPIIKRDHRVHRRSRGAPKRVAFAPLPIQTLGQRLRRSDKENKLAEKKITPLHKQWIGSGKRLSRHTLGRFDATAQIALFAVLTVAASMKVLGRMALFAGKTICRMDTSQTKDNLKLDILVTATCCEKIFRNAWRVLSAPKLHDPSLLNSGKRAIKVLSTGEYYINNVNFSSALRDKIQDIKAAYIEPTGKKE
jgi:hypothetical protein